MKSVPTDASIVHRFHPGLINVTEGVWSRTGRTAHLRQGDFDGACGQLCVWTALVVLGAVSWAEMKSMRVGSMHRLSIPFDLAVETYFLGTSNDQLVAIVDSLSGFLSRRVSFGTTREVHAFAIDRLAAGNVVVLGLNAPRNRAGHWVLGVGTEVHAVARKRMLPSILCLDPAREAAAPALFNGLLSSPRAARSQVLNYETSAASRAMTCQCAIALARRHPET